MCARALSQAPHIFATWFITLIYAHFCVHLHFAGFPICTNFVCFLVPYMIFSQRANNERIKQMVWLNREKHSRRPMEPPAFNQRWTMTWQRVAALCVAAHRSILVVECIYTQCATPKNDGVRSHARARKKVRHPPLATRLLVKRTWLLILAESTTHHFLEQVFVLSMLLEAT